MEKKCFKCGEVKSLSNFYKHSQMADGHVNKCIDCNKADVRENRKLKVSYYREYDRKRGSRQPSDHCKAYRAKYPHKYAAHRAAQYAIRAKKLFPEACETCGKNETIHAHHDDYLKPLNIRWLCSACHSQWHKKNGEGLNAK